MERNELKLEKLKKLYKILDDGPSLDIVRSYDISTEIERLEKEVKFKKSLDSYDKKILGKYPISDLFELGVNYCEYWGLNLRIKIKDEYEYFVRENHIQSVSGIVEWSKHHTSEIYDFLSGNSSYNSAFGTVSLNRFLESIEKETDPEKIHGLIQDVVKYFETDLGKLIAYNFDIIIKGSMELEGFEWEKSKD